jgi:hypothetical protein
MNNNIVFKWSKDSLFILAIKERRVGVLSCFRLFKLVSRRIFLLGFCIIFIIVDLFDFIFNLGS